MGDGIVPLVYKEGGVKMRSAIHCGLVRSEIRYHAIDLDDAAAAAVGAWETCVVAREAGPHDKGVSAWLGKGHNVVKRILRFAAVQSTWMVPPQLQ